MTYRVGSLRILLQEKICVVKDVRNSARYAKCFCRTPWIHDIVIIVYVYVCVWTLLGPKWSGKHLNLVLCVIVSDGAINNECLIYNRIIPLAYYWF